MAPDRQADEIQEERARRRSAERERIEKERQSHQRELDRLRGAPPATERPVPVASPSRASSQPRRGSDGQVASAPTSRADPTKPVVSRGTEHRLAILLRMGPQEGFDVRRLNLLVLDGIATELDDDHERREQVARRVEQLMGRVKQELDDPLNAGAFLRDRTREWFLESGAASDWSGATVPAWSGIFADSRIAGGHLFRWINLRLNAVREEAIRADTPSRRLRRVVLRDRATEAHLARSAQQQIIAEIAQAILDDLAARPRPADGPHPMVRLSELAVRRQIPTVNDGLSLLFGSPESGPFVVLHPNRYPDCDELEIRSPVATATGAALAYTLVSGRSGRRGQGKGAGGDVSEGAATIDAADSNLWESETVSEAHWSAVVEARRKERRRLESPPREFRQLPAYAPLRSLVLTNGEFRRAFLAVRWRGRPTGFPLVIALLQKGAFAPEVATDHEYLDAELDVLAEEGGDGSSSQGRWTIGDWSIVREGTLAAGLRYTARAKDSAP